MSRFYTNVTIRGDRVLYRGYEDGKRVEGGVDYRPLFSFPQTNPQSIILFTVTLWSLSNPDLCPTVGILLSGTKA